jgi:hypothetical protein
MIGDALSVPMMMALVASVVLVTLPLSWRLRRSLKTQ